METGSRLLRGSKEPRTTAGVLSEECLLDRLGLEACLTGQGLEISVGVKHGYAPIPLQQGA